MLMEELLKRDLQMDGAYDPDHLCFVLSQFDRDFDVLHHLRNNPDLNEKVKEIRANRVEKVRLLKERKAELKKLRKEFRGIEDSIEEIQSEIESLEGPEIKRQRTSSEL